MRKSVGMAGLAFGVAVIVAGCATVASGTSQIVSVSSNVQGAELYLDGDKIGTTPFTGAVRKNKGTLRIEAPGYRNETISLSKSLDPMFWGNIIIGGTLGSITDFASGAAYQYAPASYQVELQSVAQPDEAYRQQLVVRKFAMLYIDEISRDLSNGEGEYLSALIALIDEDATAEVDERVIRNALEASRGFPIAFGNKIVALL